MTSAGDRPRTRSPRRDGRSRTSRPPQATTCQVNRELVLAVRAGDSRLCMPLLVDPPIQILKKGQVGREETFNGPGGHLRHRAESGDHPRSEEHTSELQSPYDLV